VARYYFDIHDGAQSVRDDEGTEFDSLDAPVQAATTRLSVLRSPTPSKPQSGSG
jgi:hypothetical protein